MAHARHVKRHWRIYRQAQPGDRLLAGALLLTVTLFNVLLVLLEVFLALVGTVLILWWFLGR